MPSFYELCKQTNFGFRYDFLSLRDKSNKLVKKNYLNENKTEKSNIDLIKISNIEYEIPKYLSFKDKLLSDYRQNNFYLKSKNFILRRGNSYLLTAANGSGKSVFLDILCLLRKPKKGEISFFNIQGDKIYSPNIRYLYQNEQLLGGNIISYLLGRKISYYKELKSNEIEIIEKYRKSLGIDFIGNINKNRKDYFIPNQSKDIQYSGGQKTKNNYLVCINREFRFVNP